MKTIEKKKSIIIILLLINSITQAQSWQWAKHIGGVSGYDFGGSTMFVDQNSNSYVCGSFQLPCYFDTDTLYPGGYSDFYIAKYSSSGTEQWVKRFGGNNSPSNSEGIGGMCYDAANNYFYVTGSFSPSALFGSTLLSCPQQGFFLAKFDLNGNCIWAKQDTSGGKSGGSGVTVDNSGNIYVCGQNTLSSTFGSNSISAGGFIAKYDASGNCMWAKNEFRMANPVWQGYSEVLSQGIRIFNSNIIVAGFSINDTIIVDTITAYNNPLQATVIASFNLNGDVQWLKLTGTSSTGSFIGSDFSMDNQGNSYLPGLFYDSAHFGNSTLIDPNGLGDGFIVKFDINGNLKWVKQLNSSGDTIGHSGGWAMNISTNSDGYSYLSGYFSGTAHFGPYTVTSSTSASSVSSQDMFVARYDSSGVCLGVKNFGRADATAVCSDGNSFWVTGAFSSNTVTIGSSTFTNYSNAGPNNDLYVAKCDAITKVEEKMLNTNNTLTIYANPNKGTCNITVPNDLLNEQNLVLNIYDANGKLIQQQPVQVQQEKVKINIQEEATGIYNVTLGNKNKVYSGKIVFE